MSLPQISCLVHVRARYLPYRTLWGRAPSPVSRPCWWPYRCRPRRHPAGCCGWSACCVRCPACWTCTARMAPVAALSCATSKWDRKKTKQTTNRSQLAMIPKSHPAAQPPRRKRLYLEAKSSESGEAKCSRLDFEAISIRRAQTGNNAFSTNPFKCHESIALDALHRCSDRGDQSNICSASSKSLSVSACWIFALLVFLGFFFGGCFWTAALMKQGLRDLRICQKHLELIFMATASWRDTGLILPFFVFLWQVHGIVL